jgi:outer membrane protein assembly factor BamD
LHRTSLLATVRRSALLLVTGMLLLSATQCDAQIFHKKKKVNKSTSADNTAEPDKILYGKAMEDIKHGRHEVGRLNLQTLINTYPDSEYLADAKLAIADSYYKEGGTANTTQAIQAYKDFGVFFPMMKQASYAQLQVAMAHFRQMEKPDRDRSQARDAEEEFQTFLTKYPNDPLAPKAEQHLREVQEVLAEGDYRIGYFYCYGKGDKRAAVSRLISVVNRYPLYSKADQALWMLGEIWEGTEKKEMAVPYYAKIVRDYPLSPLAPAAKDHLKALKAPVPQPDPNAVKWMQAEQNAPRQHEMLIMKPMALVRTNPKKELIAAATSGKPNMTPESENEAGTDILRGGNQSRISGPGTGVVATVTPGGTGGAAEGAESVTPTAEGSEPKTGTQPDPSAAAAGSAPENNSSAPGSAEAGPKTDAAAGAGDAAAKPDAASAGSDAAKTDAAQTTDGTQNGTNADKKKESTSKKKKGIKKILPW